MVSYDIHNHSTQYPRVVPCRRVCCRWYEQPIGESSVIDAGLLCYHPCLGLAQDARLAEQRRHLVVIFREMGEYTFFPNEGHYTRDGHRAVADLLRRGLDPQRY